MLGANAVDEASILPVERFDLRHRDGLGIRPDRKDRAGLRRPRPERHPRREMRPGIVQLTVWFPNERRAAACKREPSRIARRIPVGPFASARLEPQKLLGNRRLIRRLGEHDAVIEARIFSFPSSGKQFGTTIGRLRIGLGWRASFFDLVKRDDTVDQ
jgi:hypothetical protein